MKNLFKNPKTQIIMGFIIFLIGTTIFWTQIDRIKNPETIKLLECTYFIAIASIIPFFYAEYYKNQIKNVNNKRKIILTILLLIIFSIYYFLLKYIISFL
jgi:Co/Zn/Cd efflux system component